MRDSVKLIGGHTRFDKGLQMVKHFGGEFACQAHAFNFCGVFNGDAHGSIISGTEAVCR